MRGAEREDKTAFSSNIPEASLHLGSPSPSSQSLVCINFTMVIRTELEGTRCLWG